LAVLLILPSAALAGDGFSLAVTNTRVANQRRYITVDVRVSDSVALSKDNTLLVVVGQIKGGGPPDEFGPPQNFALMGTSHEVSRHHFRAEVALPLEKVRVKFMLVDKKKVLYEQSRQL
jgi:hypothetical protein